MFISLYSFYSLAVYPIVFLFCRFIPTQFDMNIKSDCLPVHLALLRLLPELALAAESTVPSASCTWEPPFSYEERNAGAQKKKKRKMV